MISTVDEAMTIRLTKLLNIWESSRKLKAYQNDIAPKDPSSKAGAFLLPVDNFANNLSKKYCKA